MKRVALVIAIAAVLAFSLSATALAQTPPPPPTTGNGAITGTVVNKTAGAAAVGAGMDVTLVVVTNGQAASGASTKTDASGNFSFTGLSTDPSATYEALTTYLNVHYTSQDITFAAGQTSQTAEVDIYETTNSAADLSVQLAHILFAQGQGVLDVSEYSLVANSGDRTYIGSSTATTPGGASNQTLNLYIPKGATNVQYTSGLSDLTTSTGGDGLVSSMPIIPDRNGVAVNGVGYSYELSNSSSKYTFTKKIELATGHIDLLAQDQKVGITGTGLTTVKAGLTLGNTTFAYAYRENLNAGDVLTVQLSGLTGGSSQNLAWYVIVALAVLGVLAIAIFLFRRRGAPQPAPAGPSNDLVLDQGRRLLAELASLDDDFESGKIAEEEYKKLRAAKKAELVEHLQAPDDKDAK